ncbi:MAG TPA: c-type cytochrome, partial [Limnobacter sp.]|nr:c-type cytochrome [Limnobacter sp.]
MSRAFHPFVLFTLLALHATGLAKTNAPMPTDMVTRVQACTSCHGEQGRASAEGYYPRIAGKPAGYLYNQLIAFRDGGRQHAAMNGIVQHLSNDYLLHMAQHFAAQNPPYPSPANNTGSQTELETGKTLVLRGLPGRQVPACVACHGQQLTGVEPYTPGLLGLPKDYLNAQLGKWRNGQRQAAEPDCMHDLVKALTPAELNAASAYLAAQPVPANAKAAPANSIAFPLECGTHTRQSPPTQTKTSPEPIALAGLNTQEKRGAYLARAGNCMGCHTAEGGKPYAGGRAIETPFGRVYSSNLTPSRDTGLGGWSADDFYRAMHHGVSKNGEYLYPAFPYTEYTRMPRNEVDDLFAYLKKLQAVDQPTPPPALRFPYNQRKLLWVWRALYFTPGEFKATPEQSALWNRGAYLVNGPGHCTACHTPRTRLGGLKAQSTLNGSTIAVLDWFAPALNQHPLHSVGRWAEADVVNYLASGVNTHAASGGPMAEVVVHSLQHLEQSDLQAMAVYLKSLPAEAPEEKPSTELASRSLQPALRHGERVYKNECAQCHGELGQGEPGKFPALAGNASVNAPNAVNAIRAVLNGGYSPSTNGNPYPYGMPPYRTSLNDQDIAAVVTYIRKQWGNQATGVNTAQVNA